jgi:hypothetical protein
VTTGDFRRAAAARRLTPLFHTSLVKAINQVRRDHVEHLRVVRLGHDGAKNAGAKNQNQAAAAGANPP